MDPNRHDDTGGATPGRDPERKKAGAGKPTGGPRGAGPIRPGRIGDKAKDVSAALASNSGVAAERATERLAAFAHEIAGLLDGTMRYVMLARAGLHATATTEDASAADQQLGAAVHALERMADLVQAAMKPGAGTLADTFGGPRSLREAIEHAAEALKPLADQRGVRVSVRCAEATAHAKAGPLFSVVSNGLRNAIEACGAGGSVEVSAMVQPAGAGAELHLEVIDDGVGPPEGAGRRVFQPGFTSKAGSAGLGLALSKEIVEHLGGTIELRARMDGARRRGAHLRVRCPVELTR